MTPAFSFFQSSSRRARLFFCAVMLLLVTCLVGCAQSQRTESTQETPQIVRVPVETKANQVSDGPRNAANLVTNPHGRGLWDARGWKDVTDEGETEDGPPSSRDQKWVEFYLAARLPTATDYSIHGNTLNQTNSGATSGEQATTPSGAGTNTSNPNSTLTGGPMTQDPRVSANVPVSVTAAPGSTAQNGPSSAVQGEGNAPQQSGTNTATSDALIQRLRTDPAFAEQFFAAIRQQQEAAANTPTSQPGSTDGPSN